MDNAIHRSKQHRSEVLQQGRSRKFKDVQEVLDTPSEVCRMRIMQYSNTALSKLGTVLSHLTNRRCEMEIQNAVARVEKIQSLLYVIDEVQEGRMATAIKILRDLTGLSVREAAASITIARGEEPKGEVGEGSREVGLLLRKFL